MVCNLPANGPSLLSRCCCVTIVAIGMFSPVTLVGASSNERSDISGLLVLACIVTMSYLISSTCCCYLSQYLWAVWHQWHVSNGRCNISDRLLLIKVISILVSMRKCMLLVCVAYDRWATHISIYLYAMTSAGTCGEIILTHDVHMSHLARKWQVRVRNMISYKSEKFDPVR
jgi:uncharacterized membrane protein YkgB